MRHCARKDCHIKPNGIKKKTPLLPSFQLITGATSGLGLECARQLYPENNNLILVGRNKARIRSLEKEFPKSIILRCDLTKPNELKKMRRAISRGGYRLSGLFHFAGSYLDKSWQSTRMKHWQEMFSQNFYCTLLTLQTLEGLLLPNSPIVIASSIWALTAESKSPAYTVAKSAQMTLGRILAKELQKKSLNVYTICFKNYLTPMSGKYKPQMRGRIPSPQSAIVRLKKNILGKVKPGVHIV